MKKVMKIVTLDVRTINVNVNGHITSSTISGMYMKEWLEEAGIQTSPITEEDEHAAKMATIGSSRKAIDREMMRLMGLIK